LITCIFIYPAVKLGRTQREVGIKASLIVIFVTMIFSKPNFGFLSIFLFLGIAYNEINKRAQKWTLAIGP